MNIETILRQLKKTCTKSHTTNRQLNKIPTDYEKIVKTAEYKIKLSIYELHIKASSSAVMR